MSKPAGLSDVTLSWLLLLLLSLIWGSSFILIKKGLLVFTPTEVAGIRIGSASLVLVPYAVKKWRKVDKHYAKYLLISGVVGSLIPAFLFALAQTQLDSGITGVLNALTPIFVLIMGLIFFSQKSNARMIIGIFIGFVGTFLLILASSGGNLGQLNFYAFFVVLATLCYGINLNLIKYYLTSIRPLEITAISLVMVGPLTIIFLLLFTSFNQKMVYTEGAWLSFGYLCILGIIGTATALGIFNKLVKLSTPLFSSSVTYIIPIVAVLWGVFDGEKLTIYHYLSMLVILVGVFMANRRR
jgi:drug/metabolite transporter (DMT)-like permease